LYSIAFQIVTVTSRTTIAAPTLPTAQHYFSASSSAADEATPGVGRQTQAVATAIAPSMKATTPPSNRAIQRARRVASYRKLALNGVDHAERNPDDDDERNGIRGIRSVATPSKDPGVSADFSCNGFPARIRNHDPHRAPSPLPAGPAVLGSATMR
jgi:hypothetical protein